jgi:hypothetical protein
MIRTAIVAMAVASLTGVGSGKPNPPNAAALQALSKVVTAVDVSAQAADASIRAVSLAPCSQAQGPSEPMEAEVYFEPTGQVGLVSIDGAFEGTATAACVANALRRASVPAFGSPVAKVRVRSASSPLGGRLELSVGIARLLERALGERGLARRAASKAQSLLRFTVHR